MRNTRLYPDISALIYYAVALDIKELRSPVGNGASLGCPVLNGHGFSGSSDLKLKLPQGKNRDNLPADSKRAN